MTITKTLTNESGAIAGQAEPGETLTWMITLDNSGGSDALGYGVTDALDPNVVFASADNGGVHAGGVVTWSGLTVPANDTLVLTVSANVVDPIPAGVTAIGNVAYETGTTPPACPPAGSQCVVLPTGPDVAIVKALDSESGSAPGIAEPGETLGYTITLDNNGGAAATGYAVTDALDPNVTFVSADNGGALVGSNVEWSGLTVPAGGSLVLAVVVQVDDPLPLGAGEIGNVAYETGTTPPDCSVAPAPANCVDIPVVHAPFQACTANEVRATERWWYYGERGVIDFGVSGTTATALVNPQVIVADEGSTVVSDTSGNLLFWSNGQVVYDRNQDPMPNGSGLLGNPSATQAVAAFPAAGVPGRYFVVTTDTDTGIAPNGQLHYSVVDMSLNGGLGDVVVGQKNLPLGAPDTASEALTAVPNADGTGFWVLTYTNNSPDLLAYAFDDLGPLGVTISTLSTNNGDRFGSLYFNAQLDLLAQATGVASGAGQLRVLDFDAATGTAYDRFTWPAATSGGGLDLYTADFSHAGDYLYVTRTSGIGALYRYRIEGAATAGDVIASEEVVGTTGGDGGHVRRGADGRMYVVGIVGYDRLSVVNAPDDPIDPDYQGASFNLPAGHETTSGLPQTVAGCPVPTAADVTIEKALAGESGAIAGQAEAGEQLTWTIRLTNGGGTDATPFAVTDALDPNVSFVSADNGGALVGASVEWTGLTVPAYDSLVLTVVAEVADPIPAGVTTIGNVAYEAGTTPPDCSASPQPSGCVDLPTEANVTIDKSVTDASGNGEAEAGETLTYTITLANGGGSDAVNFGVTDPLDPNVAFVSADNGGAHAAGVVTWTGLAVPAGGNLVLSVVVSVADPIPDGVTTIGNVAYETGTTPPDCSATPQPAACADVPTEADVTITKTVADASGNGEAEAGETLTYTITLANGGGSDAVNFGVTDPLDPNVVFVSADNGGVLAAGVVTWSGLTVPAGGNLVLTLVVTVDDPIAAGVTGIGNVAYETGTTPPDCSASPQPAGCADLPTEADVGIAKTVTDASGNGIAEPGESLTYTIELTNTGGSAAVNYGVTDPLDPNVSFVSADNGGVHAGGVVTWTGLTVPAGGNLVLSVVVTVVDPIPDGVTTIGNVAYETGTTPPDCSTTPQPAGCGDLPTEADVTITKSVADASGNGEAEAGETLTYTITLANSGGADATGYGVTDPLDPNVVFVSADNGGVHAAGVVTWTGLTVPAGGNLVLSVVVTVVDPIPDGVTTIGNVAYETGTTPPDCSATPQPAGCVDLPTGASVSVSKALTGESLDPDGIAQPGEELTYTLTVWNQGGTPATGVIVNEWVPANTRFVGGMPTWTCAPGAPGGTPCDTVVDVPAFAAGSPGMATLTFIVAVDDPLADGVTGIANAVALDDGTPPDCVALPTQPQCVVVPSVNVSLVKSVVSVEPTGPNTARVLYRLVVTNTGGSDSVYTLTDTLDFTPDGVVFNGDARVSTLDGTLNPALPGGVFTPANGVIVQLSDNLVTLGAGTSHTYDLLVPFAVVDNVQNGTCTGGPGNGLYNQAALSGSLDVQGGACAPVSGDRVHISLVKTVALDADQNGNGLGDVGDLLRYEFEVTNTGSVPLSPVQLFDPRVTTLQCSSVTAYGHDLRVLYAGADRLFASGFEAFQLGSLDPGDIVTCEATYALTQADVDRRRVTNTATAAGAGPDGQIASATSTAIFTEFP